MKEETKNIIYTILDLLDSLSKTSQNQPNFIQIDKKLLNDVKVELLNIISSDERNDVVRDDRKTELIGMLPYVLIDKNKFPSNSDIVRLAMNSLDLEISRGEKRSRDELIGILISKIAMKKEADLEKFFNAWKKFIEKNRDQKYEQSNEDFVSIWLEFFDHYKE
jgi:hypothetical protein